MYEDANDIIERILKLVDQCPKELQEKCFEILLQGYVENTSIDRRNLPIQPLNQTPPDPIHMEDLTEVIPDAVEPRFRTTAKRLNVSLEKLSDLFDFTVDPFSFHALHVEGKNKADTTRKVALLVSAKTYLTTGRWKADWGEVKAMAVDQNCYDRANIHAHLDHEYFKSASAEDGISLSGSGTTEAEKLLAKLAGKGEES